MRADLPPSGVYNIEQAAARLGISKSTAHALIRAGEFPVPVLRIGSRQKVAVAVLERHIGARDEQVAS